jgi:bifunctional non-homologous end joining protein LigD
VDPTVAGVKISHPDRVIYPSLGVTKAELARFYEAIGEHMLPHVRGRPLTLVRCPTGLDGHVHFTDRRPAPCLYMRHAKTWGPAPLRRIHIREKTKLGEYLVIDEVAAIVALVQMGVLEIHTQNVTDADLERPDRVVFDLDPGEGVPWDAVADAADELRDRLEDIGLESWVKTTGGKGLHVCVPIERRMDWDDFKAFAKLFADALAADEPRHYTSTITKSARRNKIFVDYLRNGRNATFIAPYSPRARPGAPVAVPLSWEELAHGIDPAAFTTQTVPKRLASLAKDPWAEIARTHQAITAAMWKRFA